MTRFDFMARSLKLIGSALFAGLLVAACAATPPPAAPIPGAGPGSPATPVSTGSASQPAPSLANFYRLGAKDRVRVIVFGEEDLSGEFEVDGSGVIAMPLVGQVAAAGKTLRELEEGVAAKLREGYLKDPRVSAEVLNYRPFYIFGEVVNGGEYSFTDGMTLLNAVAVAGGYTYRADQRRVFITRADGSGEREFNTSAPVPVLPGDIIKIPERFF